MNSAAPLSDPTLNNTHNRDSRISLKWDSLRAGANPEQTLSGNRSAQPSSGNYVSFTVVIIHKNGRICKMGFCTKNPIPIVDKLKEIIMIQIKTIIN